MNFKEFNEEKFKKDTDTTELTNLEIVDEAIATLQESYFRQNDGFRRIEKVSLLAIHLLQKEIRELKKQLEEQGQIIREAREYVKRHIQKYDIDGSIDDLNEFDILASPKRLLEILDRNVK